MWHTDYDTRYMGCVDYTGEGCNVATPDKHGTHVGKTSQSCFSITASPQHFSQFSLCSVMFLNDITAGTAAGTTYGVAKGANLYSFKVLDSTGSGTFGQAMAAVDDIMTLKQQTGRKIVINMSLGGTKYDPMNDIVDQASAAGVVVVVAAGNDGVDACTQSPSSAVSAITVGATEQNDDIASFSNDGPCVDIYAPGRTILSTFTDGATAITLSGTSMAAPHVAGAAAMYLQAGKNPAVDMISDATSIQSYLLLYIGALSTSAPTSAPTNPPKPATKAPISQGIQVKVDTIRSKVGAFLQG